MPVHKSNTGVIAGTIICIIGLCIMVPFGHNGIIAVWESLSKHVLRKPDFWRNILAAAGLFIGLAGLCLIMIRVPAVRICISEKVFFGAGYLYMIIPTVVFFLGYLKIYFGILFSAVLLFGLYWHIRHDHRKGAFFETDTHTVVFVVVAVSVWIYTTGIGGYWNQAYDMHWRNACLRDLVMYSWPVIFPATGNALVYYYNFWMVPALFGKAFGLACAEAVLYAWSVIGVALVAFMLLKYLAIKGCGRALAVVLVMAVFGGLDIIGAYLYQFKIGSFTLIPFGWPDFFSGAQNTPNNQLLEWVHNQTIVPWLAVALFLNEQGIRSLAFLGLCVLPFAPLPFVGLFIIFVLWASWQGCRLIKERKVKELLFEICSIPNICAACSILVVFGLFFTANSAASGRDGGGGLGTMWWVGQWRQLDAEFIFFFAVFYLLDVYAYVLVLFKDNKRNPLFHIVALPILLYPHIRLGAGRDFGLRVWIPAMFFIMVFVLKKLFSDEGRFGAGKVVLMVFLSFSSFNFIGSNLCALESFVKAREYPIVNDENYKTFGDKAVVGPNNFLAGSPERFSFFKYLCKKKTEKIRKNDFQKYRNFLCCRGLSFPEGLYTVSPLVYADGSLCCSDEDVIVKNNGGEGAGKKIMVSKGRVPVLVRIAALDFGDYIPYHDMYRIEFPSENNCRLDVPFEKAALGRMQVWAHGPNPSVAQRWNIQPVGDCYKIIWNGYALACDAESGRVYLSLADNSDDQLWRIERAEPNECGDRFDEWKRAQGRGDDYILRRTFVLSDWLSEARLRAERYTIFLAVRDEAAVSITDEVIEKMQSLGLRLSLKGKVQHGCVAVIDRGNLVFEEMAPTPDITVITDGKLGKGLKYHIESAGHPAGNFCSIIINGHQHAVNRRGLNFVVYDNERGKVVDSVCFDTWAESMPCYR